jgi:pheromone shutdown-related protein TraB
MQHYKHLTIIGTSHIAASSIREIEKEFSRSSPDIIAVELDRNRLEALLHNHKPNYSPRLILQIGVTGYLFALIGGALQKKLGNLVGINPGSEMLKAATLARDNQKKLALIDQDVRVTLRRLSQLFTFREKLRVILDMFRSPFDKKLQIDLRGVPGKEVIRTVLKILKSRYPGLYQALIGERNHHMALKLAHIMHSHPDAKILAVVGAGHEEELAELVADKYASIE